MSKLTTQSPLLDSFSGFSGGIQLYQHQSATVRAVLDRENNDFYMPCVDKQTGKKMAVYFFAIKLEQPFGSGKTFEILALVMIQPMPKPRKIVQNRICSYYEREYCPHLAPACITTIEFSSPPLKPNLIVVAKSTANQWIKAIKDHTPLRFLYIRAKADLDLFIKEYKERALDKYDLIIITNGMMPGPFHFTKSTYIFVHKAIEIITYDSCWSRIVYDDFDTLGLPDSCRLMPTYSTIYVSATKYINRTYAHTEVVGLDYFPSILDVARNDRLDKITICADSSFIKYSINMPKAEFYLHKVKNEDNAYIQFIGHMNAEQAETVVEMLNGDAAETAAKLLGLKSISASNIFQHMMGQSYDLFNHSKKIHKAGTKTLERMNLLPLQNDCTEVYSQSDMHERLKKGKALKVKHRCAEMEKFIKEIVEHHAERMETMCKSINRVVENIRESECQICRLPLESEIFIMKCCGIILCDYCGIKGCCIRTMWDYKTRSYNIMGDCANCKARVCSSRDILFVNQDYDIEEAIKKEFNRDPPQLSPKPEKKENGKISVVLKIIRGDIGNGALFAPRINIIPGVIDKPLPKENGTKTVVVSNYEESLSFIAACIEKAGLLVFHLGGSSDNISHTLSKFENTDNSVLLINSRKHCAGMNLHFCTDLIYFHKINDPNIEGQVAGRIQRIGRVYNARLHFILYENEAIALT
jgi:hypothetical protein